MDGKKRVALTAARLFFVHALSFITDRTCKFLHWLNSSSAFFVNYFLNLKIETCTTISHAPQKANVTEAGKGPCLSEVCKELQ
jgi:hypothetical protein